MWVKLNTVLIEYDLTFVRFGDIRESFISEYSKSHRWLFDVTYSQTPLEISSFLSSWFDVIFSVRFLRTSWWKNFALPIFWFLFSRLSEERNFLSVMCYMDSSGIAPETPPCKGGILLLDYEPSLLFSARVFLLHRINMNQNKFFIILNFNEARNSQLTYSRLYIKLFLI